MKRLTLAVLLVVVSACATYPPPKIENGCYHNYKYGFLLHLPGSDWVPMDKPPSQLTAATPREMRKNIVLSLFNKERIGVIIVLSDKTQLSPDEIVTQSAGLQAGLFVGAGMQPKLKDASHCHDSSTYLQDWDACVEFEYEDAISKSKGNMFVRIFPIGNNANMIMVVFASNHITYEQNFPAFAELVKSLRHGDQYTVSQLKEERERPRQKRARQRAVQREEKVVSLPKPDSSPSNNSFEKIIGQWWMEGEYMAIEEMDNRLSIRIERREIHWSPSKGHQLKKTIYCSNISWEGKHLEFTAWVPSGSYGYEVSYSLTLLEENYLSGTRQASGSPLKIEVEFERR